MKREANLKAAEEERVAAMKTHQSLGETGLAEFPEASKYWHSLEEKSASCEDYQQQYEASKKKVTKMKVRMEGLTTQLALYEAGLQKLQEETKVLTEQLDVAVGRLGLETHEKMKYMERLELETHEKMKYVEALIEARRENEVLLNRSPECSQCPASPFSD